MMVKYWGDFARKYFNTFSFPSGGICPSAFGFSSSHRAGCKKMHPAQHLRKDGWSMVIFGYLHALKPASKLLH